MLLRRQIRGPRPDPLDLTEKFEVSLASLRARVRWTTTGYSWLHWRTLDPSSFPSASPYPIKKGVNQGHGVLRHSIRGLRCGLRKGWGYPVGQRGGRL